MLLSSRQGMNRRDWLQLSLLSGLGALSSCTSTAFRSQSDLLGHRPGPRGFRTVILDAGHGGRDDGAVRNGLREKDMTLDMVRRVQDKLSGSFRVRLLRSSDRFVDLDDRVASASRQRDAVLVSIHFNAGPRYLSGAETFYWRVDSYGLARRLQQALGAVTPGRSARGLTRRRLRLTRNPTIPCVLVECGYLSNARDAALIRQTAYRDRLADAIAYALRAQSHYGDGDVGPLPPARWDPPSKGTDARDSW